MNLVGGFSAGPRVHETDVADFERMLRLNLLPGFNLAHAAMPLLVERGGGAYVGVSARAGLRPFAGAAGYVTARPACSRSFRPSTPSTKATACAATPSCRA